MSIEGSQVQDGMEGLPSLVGVNSERVHDMFNIELIEGLKDEAIAVVGDGVAVENVFHDVTNLS